MKNHLLFLFLITVFILTSGLNCKDENLTPEEQLPSATQEGKNTFGCLVNGVALIPRGSGSSTPIYTSAYQNNQLFLNVNDRKNGDRYLNMIIDVGANNTYTLRCIKFDDLVSKCNYELCNQVNSTLNITKFDLKERIASGTFSATIPAVDSKCGEIKITDGRFDAKFLIY